MGQINKEEGKEVDLLWKRNLILTFDRMFGFSYYRFISIGNQQTFQLINDR